MPGSAAFDEPLERIAAVLNDQRVPLAAAAAALMASGLALLPAPVDLAAFASGATLGALAAIGAGLQTVGGTVRQRARRGLELVAGEDPAPQIAAGGDGRLWFVNEAAHRRFGDAAGGDLVRALGSVFADPHGMMETLHRRARDAGFAREEVPTRRGELVLTVNHLGGIGFLWRFDEFRAAGAVPLEGEGSGLPMLTVAPAGGVLFMNEAARRLIGRRVRHLDRVLTELPPRSGSICEVETPEGRRPFRVIVVELPAGRSEIYLVPEETEVPADAGGFEGLTEALPVGLLSLRSDGTIAGANRLARDLIGAHRREEPVGRPLSDWFEGLGRSVADWLADAARGRGLGKPEILRVRDAPTETFVQVTLCGAGTAAGGRGSAGGPGGLVAVLADATELKTLQQQFVQSQKMQAIGQLAGGVAHDFNNLLTAISGHCDLMLLRHDQGDPDYADLVQIHQNANRAASLVGQLLAFSRKQTLQPEVLDLRDTLADLTHLLNRLVGERVKLVLHHEASLPAIRADKRQLEQVLMNLVVNARDAMPEGGEIRIETMERVLGDDLRRDRAKVPAGRYVVVKVEDQGTGIPEDKIGKIFEPFYTTKRQGEGTGLGLSTAYGIVKQSGGFIFVDSVVGSGTVFTLYFPAHEQRRPAGSEGKPAGIELRPGARWGEERRGAARRRAAGEGFWSLPPGGEIEPDGAGAPVAAPPVPQLRAAGHRPEDERLAPSVVSRPPEPRPATLDCRIADGAPPQPARRPAEARPAPLREAAPAGAPGGTGSVVLLVEDEAPVRAFASRALRMRGHVVIEAENAEEALAILEESDLRVDVFVTDVIMPGMDGPTWVRKALERRPGVKVVFVSGYAEDSFGEEQARIPNSVFLPKPFSLNALTATVQEQLG
jgi:two-component system cell cycle sensor histidine kinase/response regulator CckA